MRLRPKVSAFRGQILSEKLITWYATGYATNDGIFLNCRSFIKGRILDCRVHVGGAPRSKKKLIKVIFFRKYSYTVCAECSFMQVSHFTLIIGIFKCPLLNLVLTKFSVHFSFVICWAKFYNGCTQLNDRPGQYKHTHTHILTCMMCGLYG